MFTARSSFSRLIRSQSGDGELVVHVDFQLGVVVVDVGVDFTADLHGSNQKRQKK